MVTFKPGVNVKSKNECTACKNLLDLAFIQTVMGDGWDNIPSRNISPTWITTSMKMKIFWPHSRI